ncbi:MAG TPA: HAD family phosphatase [Symbiobacteriaceae bacterium]|nr:HAD family phosphatase [Symbiobacteriaceae bacterium]
METQQIKALIFDMDGVIIDTEPLHKEAKRAAFETFGITVPESCYLDFRGRTDEDFAENVGREFGLSPEQRREFLQRKHSCYASLKSRILPVEGALGFLRLVRPHFAKMAVTTSATPPDQQFAFSLLGLDSFFDVVINASDITKTKPHPEPYLTTVARLGYPAEACLVIEDSKNGILSAKAAGCPVAAITTSFSRDELLETAADVIVADFRQLAAHLHLT